MKHLRFIASLAIAFLATLCLQAQQPNSATRQTGSSAQKPITTEKEALDFLYRYMPLTDKVDYLADFWNINVHLSFQARERFPWGKSVPDREFRHFVLPVRVNNENLDLSRQALYDWLSPRLTGLTMEQAVLEVNHWCHEHVTYTPSDERTSSPLATIRTAHGRCGEESTLLVAALRSVCIPARQVYTPRWAHTDDNHAWVEAWVDGKWHFLGACEPEAVLDLGWFNAPASRSMLMHTKAFGHYDGPEEVMERTECYTEIAVTDGYAPVAKKYVQVVDREGKAVPEAIVEFKIYNYAEFFTFTTRQTDSQGLTSIQAGRGDLIAWAHKGEDYGFARCRMTEQDTLRIPLLHHPGEAYSLDMDIVPPSERNTIPFMTDEQRRRNAERLAEEDALRNAYVAQRPTREQAERLADSLSLPRERVCLAIQKSQGNYQTVKAFLCLHAELSALDLLESLSDKDMRDVSLDVLLDHQLQGQPLRAAVIRSAAWSDSIFVRYILSPRVANEMLTPYRSELLAKLPKSLLKEVKKKAAKDLQGAKALQKWVAKNIRTEEASNPQALRMMPGGVLRNRLTDRRSRDIFFVALCRTLGVPARIDALTGKVQGLGLDGTWTEMTFGESDSHSKAKVGQLSLDWTPLKWNDDPKYYTHFTLSKITDGKAQLLNYPEDGKWSTTLRSPQEMDAGDYLLTSGTRMADGSVLVHLEVRPLSEGQQLSIPLTLREPEEGLQVIGSLNSEALYQPINQQTEGGVPTLQTSPTMLPAMKSLLSTTGRGYYILGFISPSNEPTNHTLRDIAAAKEALEAWGGHLVLLFRNASEAERFTNLADFKGLPTNTHFGIDNSGTIYDELMRELHLSGTAPTFVIADTFNRVVFLSEGYTIGLGERLARYLK